MDWREALSTYRADRTSGAMALAHRAAAILEGWAQAHPGGTLDGWRSDLEEVLRALRETHPDMAPPLHLMEAAREAVARAPEAEAARAALIAAARAFRNRLERHERAAARHAAALLRSARTVLTHSRSGLVARALAVAAEEGRFLHVICPIAEPGGEGRTMAEEVSAMGHTALLLPDFVAARAVQAADLILVGADAWDDAGVVNKVGTLALAVLARAFRRPFFVVAISEKRWPAWAGPHPARQSPALPPPGGAIPWFEFVPDADLTGLILEDGLHRVEAGSRRESGAPEASPSVP